MTTPAIGVHNITLAYGKEIIIEELQLQLPKGQTTVLLGSNGCGKSTLLRAMARLMQPQSGHVLLDGMEMAKLPTKEIAKRMAILPQGPSAPEGLTVLQLVKQGRYPYQSWHKQWSVEDEAAVKHAIAVTKLTGMEDRPVDALSGGQRQRAWIAMVLAQGTPTILLDEPTTYLDLTHQIEILDLLHRLNQSEQRTIVMVLHDLNLACRYADHLVAIRSRQVYAQGTPEQVVTPQMLRDVYGLECTIISDPLYGTPLCIPVSQSMSSRKPAMEPVGGTV